MLTHDAEKCNGCRLCEKNCPFGAILVVNRLVEVNERCNLCGACVNACPEHALAIARKQASPSELARYAGVFVWGEGAGKNGGDKPKKVVFELLSRGRVLADRLGEPLSAVVLGDGNIESLKTLIAHGADRVLFARHSLLRRYATDSFTNVISALIAREKPSVFLFGATSCGRDLAPRIAARLRLGLTADCTGLEIDDRGQLVQTRPAFGGNIMASIVSPYTRPQMATVRPNVFSVTQPDPSRKGTIEEVAVTLSEKTIRTKVVEEIREGPRTGAGLEEAEIIVTAGRGCRNRENLKLVEELAQTLDGVMAGSRAIVEMDWIPHTRQVGQSGTTVSPRLYVALGISGAVQHVVGMSASETVIAINCDREAPIFKIADLGVVGDALEILPRLIAAVRKERGLRDGGV